MLDRQLATLAEATKQAGYYNTDFSVSTLQKGIYVYRITVRSGNTLRSQTGKITVIK